MRRKLINLRLPVSVFCTLFTLVAFAYAEQGQSAPQILKPGMTVVNVPAMVSPPLRSLAPARIDPTPPSAAKTFEDIQLIIPKTRKGKGGQDSSVVQKEHLAPSVAMPAAIANFEGVNNVSGVLPPDTQGDIGWDPATGKKYYVQWVNLAYQIWDVTDPAAPLALLASPTAGNTLWAGTGTLCASHNDGDPLTRFDPLARRWVMSQFALSFPSNFHQCIAVSQTADPTGAWYLYDFQTSTTAMNDYGKIGVWPDGYYMSFNQFDGTTTAFRGAAVAVFEREKMLLGEAARMIYIDTGAVTLDYGGILPSDLDGPSPPAGAPNYFMEWDDSTWLGDASDTLRVWEFRTDWATPANTTFGLNASYDPNLKIVTANVDPNMCNGARNCIPQPGTAAKLDAIAGQLMYRLQYRNFGTYQTLVGNHTVDENGSDHAGIHWFELRNTGSGFAMNQQGVYAPDSDNRWMASAAMDGSGNIGLGYSVASVATYPSVRYSGRLAEDPPGTLPQGEGTIIAGTGSQTHSAARWGDYSMLAVDPLDNCTFWYTQEYLQTTGSAPWRTRIGSFKFPSCSTLPTGTLSGTVTDTASAPIAGALVEVAGGISTVTDASGNYSLQLVSGIYDLSVSKFGYTSGNASGVVLTASVVTTRNFILATASHSILSGVVSDATTAWPLYARIDGYPGGPIFTNPVTGFYSAELVDGSYTLKVTAMSGGYNSVSLPLVVSDNTTQNLALPVNGASCSAPGYTANDSNVRTEAFEAWPLTGWSVVSNVPGGLVWDTNTNYLQANLAGGTGLAATVNSDANMNVPYDTELRTPQIDPASLPNLFLTYKAYYKALDDAFDLDISSNGGASWANISHWTTDHNAATVAVNLAPYVNGPFMLRWHYYAADPAPWNWYVQVDDVQVGSRACEPLAAGGLVIGAVKDANTGALVAKAVVSDADLKAATMIDSSADTARPARMFVTAQAAGVRTLTAKAPAYGTGTVSPTVEAGGTVGQDFLLSTGRLSANPASLTFNVNLATDNLTKSLPLNLDNAGGEAAGYELFKVPGIFSGYAPVGPFADHTRHTGPMNLNDRDAKNLRIDLTPTAVTLLGGGNVSTSWPTGLTYSWGIGFNTDTTDLWLSNLGLAGGDNLDYRFTIAGVKTTDTIDTTTWLAPGGWSADMAYNPFTRKLWQLNVGGDNCVYEMDPATKTSTGNKICPAFGISQRGLAFDPLSSTYYSGSWSDGIINHFAPDGTILDSKAVSLSISGLAFNPGTGHLFVLTNAPTSSDPAFYDVYVLDTQASYAILGGFNLKNGAANAFADSAQAGLELDCVGNLWAVDQLAQKVYVAASGETGVCDWQLTWLSATPASGTVAAGGKSALTIDVNAASLSVGAHNAYLRVENSSPYGPVIVPVTVNVTDNHIFINNGDARTSNPAVTLKLSYPGAAFMQFLIDKSTKWTKLETFNSIKPVKLPSGNGLKNVAVRFVDNNGIASAIYNAGIFLDAAAPVGTISINSGAAYTDKKVLVLGLSASDSDSSRLQMRFSEDGKSWTENSWVSYAPAYPYTLGTLPAVADVTPGLKKVYVQFKDDSGKLSKSYFDTITYAPADDQGANSTIIINGGAGLTKSTTVTLVLLQPGKEQYVRLSNDGKKWGKWLPQPFPTTWKLASGDGVKTVYAQYSVDAITATATYSSTIKLDVTPPAGWLLINNGVFVTNSAKVDLTMGASDVNGVAGMCIKETGSACIDSEFEGYANIKEDYVIKSTGDGTKSIYISFKDIAGNVSKPVKAAITLDKTASAGSVIINGGKATTTSTTVSLKLITSKAVYMQISLDGGVTWGEWEAYGTAKTVVLAPDNGGVMTVKVRYKDFAGNESPVCSDSINLVNI